MPFYIVKVPEIHISSVRIEANSLEEAIEKVCKGEGEETVCDYESTIEHQERKWEVEEDDSHLCF